MGEEHGRGDRQQRHPLQSYNLDHQPIGMLEGAMLLGSRDTKIAEHTINGTRVSTDFMVIDQSHGHGPVPLLYETMAFAADGDIAWVERYPTRDAALAGHDRVCAWLRSPDQAPAPLHNHLTGPTGQ